MLSNEALQLIKSYLNLPFQGVEGVHCPYFNNWKLRQRGQLRVLTGKGTPKEIVEEAKIISIQYHAGLFDATGHCCLHKEHAELNVGGIRQFLIEHNLGIDCSGFVTHVLSAHFLEKYNINLPKKLIITDPKKNLGRWIISKLRPVENIGVRVYADDRNSIKILDGKSKNDFKKIQPADLIIMIETGPNHNRNHVILIIENNGRQIKYVNARAWPSEGQFGHGVTEGFINITNPNSSLLEQEWVEKGRTNEQNETYTIDAMPAKRLEIRRIRIKKSG